MSELVNRDNQVSASQAGTWRVVVDDTGALTTISVAALDAGAKVTSSPILCCDYVEALVSVYSDQISATDGLKLQVSVDGLTWYDQDVYTYLDGGFKLWKAQLPLSQMRIEYTNGATPQTSFLLAIKLQKTNGVDHSMRIADTVSGQDDACLVKAIISAARPGATGTYTNIQATTAGNLKISAEESDPAFWRDFGVLVADGLISDYSRVNKFGAAPMGIQTTATDIWSRANETPTQQIWLAPTAARVHALVSSSAADAAGGTGALSVVLFGLKTWDSPESSETVTLTGTTPVNTANSYVIIHRMRAIAQATTTSVGVNTGTITATAATDNTVTAVILPNDGQTEMAIYGIPSGYTFYLKRWSAAIDRTGGVAITCDFELRVNENPNVQTVGFVRKDDISVMSFGTSGKDRTYEIPPSFSGPCIIKVQAIASAADTDGKAGFDGYIVAG